MCTMLKRYIDYKTITLEAVNESIKFTDSDEISDYAAQAVDELTQYGIINGFDTGVFKPSNGASRAECAAVVMRFINAMNPSD